MCHLFGGSSLESYPRKLQLKDCWHLNIKGAGRDNEEQKTSC